MKFTQSPVAAAFGRFFMVGAVVGLTATGVAGQQTSPRTMRAKRITADVPRIDGRLDDAPWIGADIATDFIQREPQAGARATQRTTVAVLYDNGALYVGMRMFDTQPHLIQAPLSRRDDANVPAEWVTVNIDSNFDRRNAFKFATTPRGVQYDAVFFEDSREDNSWDAVWEVATTIDSLGWTAEFRIPLSQLRYNVPASGDAGSWGVNFGRDVSRLGEVSHWAPITPGTGRVVSYFGTLVGLDGIAANRRLEIMPYTLGRLSRVPGQEANPFYSSNDASASAGADIKLGLTSNLTLTATINPDFGQVEADPSVVNLGTFETFFTERRPFFTEGADIFRMTMSPELNVFYSRRVGRPPQRSISAPSSGFIDVPETARILGAAKISGRTSKGWSMGILHAVTAESNARIVDAAGTRGKEPVEPLSQYSVARFIRDFRRGQSGIGFIGTSTFRQLDDSRLEFLRSRAFATGTNGWHRFSNNRYEARLLMIGTAVHGTPASLLLTQTGSVHRFQRPDATHLELDSSMTDMTGWGSEGSLQKIAGDWHGGITYGARSPGLELNDGGYNTSTDNWYISPSWNHRRLKAGKHLRTWTTGVTLSPAWTFGGELVRSMAEYRLSGQLRNFWGGSIAAARWQGALSPSDLRGGPAIRNVAFTDATVRVNSNPRRDVSGSVSFYGYYAEETAERRITVTPQVVLRPSAASFISITPSGAWNRDEDQYIRTVVVNRVPHYVMGRLNQTTASLTARVSYVFSPDLALDVYAQPFLSSGRYSLIREVRDPKAEDFDSRFSTFGEDRASFDKATNRYSIDLQPDGAADFTIPNPDFNVRQLRANTVLRWQYRPGSTIYLVWSQARDNGVLSGGMPVRRELDRLFAADARNVFLVKASYWLGR
jgi:hypothetical protein